MHSYYVGDNIHLSFYFTILLLISIPLFLTAQEKQAPSKKLNIAVMDFDAREGLTRGEAASLSDLFSSQMVATEEFTVVDRNRIKAILMEQGFQQSEACSQVECIVEAGKILRVEKMFSGNIGKIGRIYSVNIQMIDIATSQIEINKSQQYDGNIEGLAEEVIPELAKIIAEQVSGKQINKTGVGKVSSSKWLWYVGSAAVIAGGAAAYFILKSPENPPITTEEKLPNPPTLP
jgi:TolB-like protein